MNIIAPPALNSRRAQQYIYIYISVSHNDILCTGAAKILSQLSSLAAGAFLSERKATHVLLETVVFDQNENMNDACSVYLVLVGGCIILIMILIIAVAS